MSRNSKEIKIEKQLKNIRDTLNKKMKIACDSLDNNIYVLNKSMWNAVEKKYGEKPYNYDWQNTLH